MKQLRTTGGLRRRKAGGFTPPVGLAAFAACKGAAFAAEYASPLRGSLELGNRVTQFQLLQRGEAEATIPQRSCVPHRGEAANLTSFNYSNYFE